LIKVATALVMVNAAAAAAAPLPPSLPTFRQEKTSLMPGV